MSDLLGDALARWDDNHPARPMTTFYYSQVVAAARKWHTLTNPTDELIEQVAQVLHDNDEAYAPPYWSDCNDDMKWWYRKQARAVLWSMLCRIQQGLLDKEDTHDA